MISIAVEDARLAQFLALIRSLRYAQVVQPANIAPEATTTVSEPTLPAYSFTDLVGKLAWQGDALIEQQRLRDEW